MEIQDTVYGQNVTVHTMNGTAMQRAIRGHLLVDQWLKSWRMTLLFKTRKLDMLGENDLESSLQSDCICHIDKAIDTQKAMNWQEPPKPAHC